MSLETENFEALRKLLAVKKHEAPPPGYFDHLASDIRSRLANGEHRQSDWWREMGEEASWLQRLWASLAERPAFAGAFGMMVCGLVLGGFYFSQKPEVENATATLAESFKMQAPSSAPLQVGQVPNPQVLASSSTNPVMAVPTGASVFDQIGVQGQAAPVSFNGN